MSRRLQSFGLFRAEDAAISSEGSCPLIVEHHVHVAVQSSINPMRLAPTRALSVSNSQIVGCSGVRCEGRGVPACGNLRLTIGADGSASANNWSCSHSSNAVTSADPTGKQLKLKWDAAGRRIEVDEPDPSNGNTLTLIRTHFYDPLDNTTQIS